MEIHKTIAVFERDLTTVISLKDKGEWSGAWQILAGWLRHIVGRDPGDFPDISDAELLFGLMRHSMTYSAPYNRIMLIRSLKETGDVTNGFYSSHGGRHWYVRALNLLLISSSGLKEATPEYLHLLPNIDSLVAAIGDSSIPTKTRILVMREYERNSQFGRVRVQYLAELKSHPDAPKLLAFGIGIFTRIASQNDAALKAGNLPRSELDPFLSELAAKLALLKSKREDLNHKTPSL